MSHMVMFRSAEGKPGYHQTESLDEAIGFVEHLRNQEQVPEARIFRMEEIPIEVKTYYKVEVSRSQAPAVAPAKAAPAAPATTSASAASPPEKATVPTEEPVVIEPMMPANGGGAGPRFGRFNRS
ncbi:MAG: hypothetical protein M3P85_05525 [Actinomycetota bacterium]|jgi:hypothetical protein|nr:hypothetical protein [Actinomycetota bacterium]